MAGTVVVDTVKSSTTSAPAFQNTSGTAVGQLSNSWVNFNAYGGTITIRAQFNVTSVTYNSEGNFTVNLTNALPSANYVVSICLGGSNAYTYRTLEDTTARTASLFRFNTLDSVFSNTNPVQVNVSTIGG
jgi:hypothetical protein